MMGNKDTKNQQEKLDLKYSGFPFIERINHRIGKYYVVLDQFNFWKSSSLWVVIFLNIIGSFFVINLVLSNAGSIPQQIPIFFYLKSMDSRFIDLNTLLILIASNIFIQLFTIYISNKTYFKMRNLSVIVLITLIISSSLFYLSIFKSLRMLL